MQLSNARLMAHLALAASLGLTSCATRPAAGARPGGDFWTNLATGRYSSLSNRRSEATGYVLKRARLGVSLSPVMPRQLSDGTYALDFNNCVALLVSDEQYALLEHGSHIRVRGEFGVRTIAPSDDEVITQPSIRDRRTGPICSSAEDWTDSLLFYVEDFSKVAP